MLVLRISYCIGLDGSEVFIIFHMRLFYESFSIPVSMTYPSLPGMHFVVVVLQ